MKVNDPGRYIIIGGSGTGGDDFGIVADEAIALTGKEQPFFLFVGFAQLQPIHGFEYYGLLFAGKGCTCAILTDADVKDPQLAKAKIDRADIIYLMGGNTGKLLRTLREHGVDTMLRDAARRGTVMTGFSAGAITLCESGISKNEDYLVETGIGCVDLVCCPHPIESRVRFGMFCDELKKRPGAKGMAFDGAGLEICGGKCRALIFAPDGFMTDVCEYKNGVLTRTALTEKWVPVEEI